MTPEHDALYEVFCTRDAVQKANARFLAACMAKKAAKLALEEAISELMLDIDWAEYEQKGENQ